MWRTLLMSWVIVVGTGCASTGASRSARGMPLGQPAGEALRLEGDNITGPNSSLVLKDSVLRGQFQGTPVDVSWTGEELTGSVGLRPARVQLDTGTDLHVWGSFGAARVDFTIKPDRVEGQVGRCVYELRRVAPGLIGRRGCAGPLETEFRVNFPASLFERSPGERAALMILALANSTPTYAPVISPARQTPPPNPIGRPVAPLPRPSYR